MAFETAREAAGVRRSKIYFAFGALLLLSVALSVSRPHAFQKLNTLVPADGFEPLRRSATPVDIAGIIGMTPYQAGRATAVDPEKKYRQTVEEGAGNCSERAFGLAWKLRQSNIDYQIVHLLPPSGIVRGVGHTVIRVAYDDSGETRIGLADLLAGGLPTSGGEPLDIEDLTSGSISDFKIRSLTGLRGTESQFYGEYLEGASIGYIRSHEIDRYFSFIERIYVPLGNDRLEKLLYDGISLLFGMLPEIYVPSYENLIREHRFEKWLQNSALWVLRSALLIIPCFLVFETSRRFRSAPRPAQTAWSAGLASLNPVAEQREPTRLAGIANRSAHWNT